jgi:hypothetical protein
MAEKMLKIQVPHSDCGERVHDAGRESRGDSFIPKEPPAETKGRVHPWIKLRNPAKRGLRSQDARDCRHLKMGIKTWMARQEKRRARRVDYRGGDEATAAPEATVAQEKDPVIERQQTHDDERGDAELHVGTGGKRWQATEKK